MAVSYFLVLSGLPFKMRINANSEGFFLYFAIIISGLLTAIMKNTIEGVRTFDTYRTLLKF